MPAMTDTDSRIQDALRSEGHPLDAFFAPKSVAVIGATETRGSVGRTILRNLIATSFGGPVFPVNPNRKSVLGIKAYPNIGSVPDHVDLAVVVTPAASVPGIIGQCVDAGIKAAVVISAGFKEIGPEGEELEHQVMEQARRGSMRVIGPNCLGVMSPAAGLNATFASTMAHRGSVAFVSQSGALLTAVLDYSLREMIGFSAFVSLGSMLDVGWGDIVDYLGNDPQTRSIVLYMESIGDARAFLSAAREVALKKPIIVIKAGRTALGARAAASHTGSLAGSDDVLTAAFRRCGVLRVDSIADVFYMAEVLGKQPCPRGPRLTILTNAGGPGVLATDSLIAGGGELAVLSEKTGESLNAILPQQWSHSNPIDVLGDAPPERYEKALSVAMADPNSDGLLVILTPQSMTDPTTTAQFLRPYATVTGKPVIACWMGGGSVEPGKDILNRAGIPTFLYPDTACRVFNYMWQYNDAISGIYETPALSSDLEGARNSEMVDALLATIGSDNRTILTETESKEVLAAYGIPTVTTVTAADPEAAVRAADVMGYPVVLKLHSETITHKTDVGGVKLDIRSADAVRTSFAQILASVTEKAGAEHFQGVSVQPMISRDGYEIIIGSSVDPQFGPVLLFGSGGQLVEVYEDRALALPPLTTTLARRMMEGTKIYRALKGVRGRPPVDLNALEQLLVRFSDLVMSHPRISEVDINPLVVSHERILALDARMVLHDSKLTGDELPQPAIRPYPHRYVRRISLRDGTPVCVRPIRAEDEAALARLHETLSERSVYLRYFQALKFDQRVKHERLSRACFNDFDREIALVAEIEGDRGREIIGVGRLTKIPGRNTATFALLIGDKFQGQGLGRALLGELQEIACDEKLDAVTGEILRENILMQHLAAKMGFSLKVEKGEPSVLDADWIPWRAPQSSDVAANG